MVSTSKPSSTAFCHRVSVAGSRPGCGAAAGFPATWMTAMLRPVALATGLQQHGNAHRLVAVGAAVEVHQRRVRWLRRDGAAPERAGRQSQRSAAHLGWLYAVVQARVGRPRRPPAPNGAPGRGSGRARRSRPRPAAHRSSWPMPAAYGSTPCAALAARHGRTTACSARCRQSLAAKCPPATGCARTRWACGKGSLMPRHPLRWV